MSGYRYPRRISNEKYKFEVHFFTMISSDFGDFSPIAKVFRKSFSGLAVSVYCYSE